MSERVINDPSVAGWVEDPNTGYWMWADESDGGSIQDGDTDGQVTTWSDSAQEWTPDSSLTIDADGRVCIGTDNTSYNFEVSGTGPIASITSTNSAQAELRLTNTIRDYGMYTDASGKYVIRDRTGSANRFTIDSSGTVLIGMTSASSLGSVNTGFTMSGDGSGNIARNTNGSVLGFFSGSGFAGSITVSGLTTDYGTSSDQRLKENIVDAPAGNIDDIRVRSFNWKFNGSHQKYGVIAQELAEVAPEAVSQSETEGRMWCVDYSKLVPMMIKEIQDLKAEVAVLKGSPVTAENFEEIAAARDAREIKGKPKCQD